MIYVISDSATVIACCVTHLNVLNFNEQAEQELKFILKLLMPVVDWLFILLGSASAEHYRQRDT